MSLDLYKVPYEVYLAHNKEAVLNMAKKKWYEEADYPEDFPLGLCDVVQMGEVLSTPYGFMTLDEIRPLYDRPVYLGTLDTNGFNGYDLYFDKSVFGYISRLTGIIKNPIIFEGYEVTDDVEKGGIKVEVRHMKDRKQYRVAWIVVQRMDSNHSEVSNLKYLENRIEAVKHAIKVLEAWKTLMVTENR